MGNREKYKYSVISYIANPTRYEKVNIGLVMINLDLNIFQFSLLPENTPKIKGLLISNDEKKLFKETLNYINFRFNGTGKIYKENKLVDIQEIFQDLPNTISFSKFIHGSTSNTDLVFKTLINEYIGNEYFKVGLHREPSFSKRKIENYFNNNFLQNNVLVGPRIKPTPSSPFLYQPDYAYIRNEELGTIQIAPDSEDGLEKWYQKILGFSSRYQNTGTFVLLYDYLSDNKEQKKQVIYDLSANDDRFTVFNTEDQYFNNFESFSMDVLSQSSKERTKTFIDEYNEQIV